MYTAMEAELSGLKIPFFCIDKRLLGTSMENREPREIETGTTIGIEDLRKKMCQLLEDLCRD